MGTALVFSLPGSFSPSLFLLLSVVFDLSPPSGHVTDFPSLPKFPTLSARNCLVSPPQFLYHAAVGGLPGPHSGPPIS